MMIVSGFYMTNGTSANDSRVNVEKMFVKDVAPSIVDIFRRATFEVTDVIRTKEYDEGKGLKAYDVHFLLDIPNANIKEDTRAFYDLEAIVHTGLGITEEELLRDAV